MQAKPAESDPFRSGAMRRRGSPLLVGLAATLALAILLAVVAHFGHRVPNPNLLFALVLVWSAFSGGIAAGLGSAAVAILYTLRDWSVPGHPLTYAGDDARRLLVVVVCLPAMAWIVGYLKNRSEAQRRVLESFLDLERERNLALARTAAQIEHPEGSIPVCAWCHRVREEQGAWMSLEQHFADRYGATLTHGICPDCRTALMASIPDWRGAAR